MVNKFAATLILAPLTGYAAIDTTVKTSCFYTNENGGKPVELMLNFTEKEVSYLPICNDPAASGPAAKNRLRYVNQCSQLKYTAANRCTAAQTQYRKELEAARRAAIAQQQKFTLALKKIDSETAYKAQALRQELELKLAKLNSQKEIVELEFNTFARSCEYANGVIEITGRETAKCVEKSFNNTVPKSKKSSMLTVAKTIFRYSASALNTGINIMELFKIYKTTKAR